MKSQIGENMSWTAQLIGQICTLQNVTPVKLNQRLFLKTNDTLQMFDYAICDPCWFMDST